MAALLVAHRLGLARHQLILLADTEPTDAQQQTLEADLERLLRHEPLQYVLGEADFMGLRIQVGPGVLIPRPETEELVQWVAQTVAPDSSILDVGTGSGCIALGLKQLLPQAYLEGWDASEQALAYARQNADALGLAVHWALQDVFRARLDSWPVVVSNPPYIPPEEAATLHPHVRDWEPHQALFAPQGDPLAFYTYILLHTPGAVFLECHSGTAEDLARWVARQGMPYQLRNDLQGRPRMLYRPALGA
jgi:release factor glutamine methyltransferase